MENSPHLPCNLTKTIQKKKKKKEIDVYGANFPWPPPDIIEGEEVYEVEWILKHRKQGQGYQYYVAWKGYPISEASWDPEQMMETF